MVLNMLQVYIYTQVKLSCPFSGHNSYALDYNICKYNAAINMQKYFYVFKLGSDWETEKKSGFSQGKREKRERERKRKRSLDDLWFLPLTLRSLFVSVVSATLKLPSLVHRTGMDTVN
ncbi:hypothetical protein CR513_02059, partial [Mucuna pruriens]